MFSRNNRLVLTSLVLCLTLWQQAEGQTHTGDVGIDAATPERLLELWICERVPETHKPTKRKGGGPEGGPYIYDDGEPRECEDWFGQPNVDCRTIIPLDPCGSEAVILVTAATKFLLVPSSGDWNYGCVVQPLLAGGSRACRSEEEVLLRTSAVDKPEKQFCLELCREVFPIPCKLSTVLGKEPF